MAAIKDRRKTTLAGSQNKSPAAIAAPIAFAPEVIARSAKMNPPIIKKMEVFHISIGALGNEKLSAVYLGLNFQTRSTRPGFIKLCGSKACLMARIMPSATGDLCCSSLSALRLPTPCSAEIEPL